MRRGTYERALHKWPEWGTSIKKCRAELEYDPRWSKEERKNWHNEHHPLLREKGRSELKRLFLPPNLLPYWEACFLSDYMSEAGMIDYQKICSFPDHKILPEPPFESRLAWLGNEDIHDPWLRIEIFLHKKFFTKGMFEQVVGNAYQNVKSHLWWSEQGIPGWKENQLPVHPVVGYIDAAKVETPMRNRQVIELWQHTQDIDKTLHTWYFDPETQAELSYYIGERANRYESSRIEKAFRKRIRDRVVKVLTRSGIDVPRPKTKWWLSDKP